MSFQAIEEAFKSPTLTITRLRNFWKECLQKLCEEKSIKISYDGKRMLKEKYVQALFSTVSGYKVSDTKTQESTLEA